MMKDKTLENFMKEFFPFNEFKKIGFFTKEMKGDYSAQAERVCTFFGYKTVYEYGAKEIRCHVSEQIPMEINSRGEFVKHTFVTVIPSIF